MNPPNEKREPRRIIRRTVEEEEFVFDENCIGDECPPELEGSPSGLGGTDAEPSE